MTTASGSSKPESVMDSWTGPPSSGTCDAPISDDWPEWWTSSLPDSPASPTASPEDASAPLTSGTSGRTPLEPFATWDRGGCCWRTFQASLLTGMPEPWSGNWPSSAMTALGTAYRLPPLVRHTSVGGGSVYPTPLTTDAQGASGPPLSQSHATKWDGANSLGRMAQQGLWPTPTVNGNNNRAGLSEKSGDGLQTAVRLWPTPQSRDYRTGDAQRLYRPNGQRSLNDSVLMWPTPVASDSDRQSAAYGGGSETLLGAVASRWPTPMAHDGKAPRTVGEGHEEPRPVRRSAVPDAGGVPTLPEPLSESRSVAETEPDGYGGDRLLADARREGRQKQRAGAVAVGAPHAGAVDSGATGLADAEGEPARRGGQPRADAGGVSWWAVEPALGRVVDGHPHRVDQLRALGNGIVPAVVARFLRGGLRVSGRDPSKEEK